jgi:hypothetical protein
VYIIRNAEPTGQLRQTDKDPTEKALFAFTGGAVLAEELGGEAGHLEMLNRLFSPGMADKNSPEKDTTKCGTGSFILYIQNPPPL